MARINRAIDKVSLIGDKLTNARSLTVFILAFSSDDIMSCSLNCVKVEFGCDGIFSKG